MSKRILAVAVVILIISVVGALLTKMESTAKDGGVGAPVLSGLRESLESVERLKVESKSESTTLVRKGAAFVVAERGSYPASFWKVAEVLRGLAETTRIERKTSRPENFALLNLEPPSIPDGQGMLLTVFVNGEDEPYRLLTGRKSDGLDGQFARDPDQNQVWLIDELPLIEANPGFWIETMLLNVDAKNIVRVTQRSSEGDSEIDRSEIVAVQNDEGSGFTLPALPEGAELRYDTVVDTLGRGLVNVNVNDVRPRTEMFTASRTAEYDLSDGSVISISATQVEKERWIRIEIQPGEKPLAPVADLVAREVEDFDYKVSDLTFERFNKTMDDMLKPIEEVKETDEGVH